MYRRKYFSVAHFTSQTFRRLVFTTKNNMKLYRGDIQPERTAAGEVSQAGKRRKWPTKMLATWLSETNPWTGADNALDFTRHSFAQVFEALIIEGIFISFLI